jgi:heterodisulfide reductase subunit A-like polyferredoxin
MELACEVLVVGGGCGGVAAALAASDMGRRVILTEGTTWLGGQMTSQAVPPDEHPWVALIAMRRSRTPSASAAIELIFITLASMGVQLHWPEEIHTSVR